MIGGCNSCNIENKKGTVWPHVVLNCHFGKFLMGHPNKECVHLKWGGGSTMVKILWNASFISGKTWVLHMLICGSSLWINDINAVLWPSELRRIAFSCSLQKADVQMNYIFFFVNLVNWDVADLQFGFYSKNCLSAWRSLMKHPYSWLNLFPRLSTLTNDFSSFYVIT